jgi:FkbM family methyltransferase
MMVQALKAFPRLAKIARHATGRILHRPDIIIARETIGSDYGAHTVPAKFLTAQSIVYSFGIGTDASFDSGVISRYGCRVHGFDPTPKCIQWVSQQDFGPDFCFHPIGLGEEDGNIPFQVPEKETHVSFSRAEDPASGVWLPVRRLKTIMHDLGHEQLDLLKLDIEGFEYAALREMLASRIFPRVIAVEFHHRMYDCTDRQTREAVASLKSVGYLLFHVSDTGREYSFMLPA